MTTPRLLALLLSVLGGCTPSSDDETASTAALAKATPTIGFGATPVITIAPLVDSSGKALGATALEDVALASAQSQLSSWRAHFFGNAKSEAMIENVLTNDLTMTSVTGTSNPNQAAFEAWLDESDAATTTSYTGCTLDASSTKLVHYTGLRNWTATAYETEAFNGVARYLSQQASVPKPYGSLFKETLENVVFNALAYVNFANATSFDGVTLDDPWNGGKRTTPLGWNNLGSDWGAWSIGTCILGSEPNTWAGGWSLLEIGKGMNAANELYAKGWLTAAQNASLQAFLARAFYRGAAFWNSTSTASSSPALAFGSTNAYSSFVGGEILDFYRNDSYKIGERPSGSSYEDDGTTFGAFGDALLPIDMQLNYVIGGMPSKLASGIRYSYGWASPGLVDNNTTAIMSLAMTYAGALGLGLPDGTAMGFSMRGYDTSDVIVQSTLTMKQIGYDSMLPVNHDMADSMLNYSNFYTPRYAWEHEYESNDGSQYEAHAPFTIFYLAAAGAITSEAEFTTNAATAATSMGAIWSKYGMEPDTYGSCLLRSLGSGSAYDAQFSEACTAALSASYNASKSKTLTGTNLWLLLASFGG